ncbi:MAG TPA: hypothetical protein VKU00_11325, partial [Chthonomonadaceae bacterium]|nr:hypothetical protein [Chthonomonadaceae bacterium]
MRTDPKGRREIRQPESLPARPLLTTKLAIPTMRAGQVARARLTDRLDLSTPQRLLLVEAPAGWGKTSLLSEWIARQANGPRSIAWVSLDPGDNDPMRFLLYLTAACGRAHPGLGEAAHALLLSPQPAPPDVVLTQLLNEIGGLDHPLTIVLDDYHMIEEASVHEAATFLLEHLPPCVHLVLATRTDPPLPLPRMRARGQLLDIRTDDLRFTQDEAAAFLNQVMGLNLNADSVAHLEARTEGWIAGLQLAALSLQGREDLPAYIAAFTGSNRFIVDYLFDEVLARQPEALQTSLMETAILNRLCAPLCEAVTGQSGGQALLERLEADNLFISPLDDARRWYRYHPLFADVLRARLAEWGEARVMELHARASAWYAQEGMVEEAVFHALESRHWEMAARLIERYSDALWEQGGQRTLERWLKALPTEWVARRPVLSVMQAFLHLSALRFPAALATLDTCRRTVQNEEVWTPDIQGRAAAIRSSVQRLQGQLDVAVTLAQEALACLAEDNGFWRSSALVSLGVALSESDHLSAANTALIEAIAESRCIGNMHTYLL